MKAKRHKWSGTSRVKSSSEFGGLAVACKNCGCVKEFVKGQPTYFLNDSVFTKAPECLKSKENNIDENFDPFNPEKP